MLLCLFCFDILTFIVRTLQLTLGYRAAQREWATFVPQIINMALLWTGIYCINRHSRKGHGKHWAAFQVSHSTPELALRNSWLQLATSPTHSWRVLDNMRTGVLLVIHSGECLSFSDAGDDCLQEEALLSATVALAVSVLLLNLRKGSGQDYTFACFFLISATLLLRVRWHLGTACLAMPVLLVHSAPLWGSGLPQVLPQDAEVHLTVAWALGALVAFLADAHRRCVCGHHAGSKLLYTKFSQSARLTLFSSAGFCAVPSLHEVRAS